MIILDQGEMCDGYDVLVDVDGEHMTVHFRQRPDDVEAAAAAFVAAMPAAVVYEVEGE